MDHRWKFIPLAMVLGATAPMGLAQDASGLTASEIEQRFKNQQTRGLVIAPATTEQPAPETPAPTQEYVAVNPEDQINVRISFDFDSAALRNSEKAKLATLCTAMRNIDIPLFRIVGHTDSAGSAEYNERLSLLRAEEVKRHMVNECGINPLRLEALGVGEAFPIDTRNTRSEENRRVEFQAGS